MKPSTAATAFDDLLEQCEARAKDLIDARYVDYKKRNKLVRSLTFKEMSDDLVRVVREARPRQTEELVDIARSDIIGFFETPTFEGSEKGDPICDLLWKQVAARLAHELSPIMLQEYDRRFSDVTPDLLAERVDRALAVYREEYSKHEMKAVLASPEKIETLLCEFKENPDRDRTANLVNNIGSFQSALFRQDGALGLIMLGRELAELESYLSNRDYGFPEPAEPAAVMGMR